MRSEIELFINLGYSQEKIELFKKCFSVFEEFHLEDYDLSMMELISMFDSMDSTQVFLEFEVIVKNTLVSVIAEHGITINTEASLEMVCEIARCLNAIQSYDDKDSIIRTMESDYDNEEKLCQLFRFVSEETVDNFMLSIDVIDQNIFSKLYELYANIENVDYSEEDSNTVNKIIKQLKQFKTFLNYDEAIGFKLLSKGFFVYGDFNLYLKYCVQKFETMQVDYIAKELIVLLFMSKQSYASPLMYFRSISSSIFDDFNKITKVDVELNSIINKFELYKAQQTPTTPVALENLTSNTLHEEVPAGDYLGFISGYVVEFIYNDVSYEVKTEHGVRGKNIPCKVTKTVDGLFKVTLE